MDMAEDELAKDIDDIVPTRLESLLELALKTSVMETDPHHDEVRIELLNDTVLTQLSKIISYGGESEVGQDFGDEEDPRNLRGYESIALTYRVEWPLSLILSRKNIACYQMLFRHLFYCKYVERQLACVWKENKIAKLYALKAVTGYAEAFALRQKMLNFVQNLEYYMMVEVIEPSFHQFLAKVHSKAQVDEISREHTNFVEGCLRDCMMTHKLALQYMVRLLRLCMSFSEFMLETHRHSVHYELQTDAKPYEAKVVIKEEDSSLSEDESLSFEQKVRKTHDEFNVTLQQLLGEITNQQQEHFSGNILHILNRLDFNEFYSRMRDETETSASGT
jgi:gamma-tubulin complex component 2